MRALLARYPALAPITPHVDLGVRETPLERWTVNHSSLLIKRDDLSADPLGGNKARALEWLLAGVARRDTVLTVGGTGSTHALAVARYGALLGAAVEVITWPQEINAVARATASALGDAARVMPARSVPEAYARALLRRVRRRRWIPAGGSVPAGALGHVNAALELAAQLERERLAAPETIVVPLGSGGTTAGLLVGLALAGLPTRVVAVQVVPRIVANHWRVMRLARRTRDLLAQRTGEALPPVRASRLSIDRSAYGGAYGRETPKGRRAAEALRESGGPPLDPTYSAKAFAVALDLARRSGDGRVLFWLTFDARWLPPAHPPTTILR